MLKTMVDMQAVWLERHKPARYCTLGEHTGQAGAAIPRVRVDFKSMLEKYKKEGLEGKHKDLYNLLDQMDIIAQAYQLLSRENLEVK